MKWAHSIQQKIKVAMLLASVCAIILLKNIYDKHKVDELGSTFSSVYEDRLLVESYIYELSDHLYQKKILINNISEQGRPSVAELLESHNLAINSIIEEYELTKFTTAETTCFRGFKNSVEELQTLERRCLQLLPETPEWVNAKNRMNQVFIEVSDDLHRLSDIQISEGKLLSDNSKKIVAGSSILTRLELAILITIAIFIQVLIAASKPMLPTSQQQANLN